MEKTYIDANQQIGGWFVQPNQSQPSPAIVLMPAVHGLTSYIEETIHRLARHGYTVFALDYYTTLGQPQLNSPEDVQKTLAGISDNQVMEDAQAVVNYLKEQPNVKEKEIGVMGFCVGGKFAYLAGCEVDGVKAAVNFYGMIHVLETDNHPVSPIKKAGNLNVPLLGHYGTTDHLIPKEHVLEYDKELQNNHKHYEIRLYQGAGHAFHDHTRPNYRAVAAKEAWTHTLHFFDFHLKGIYL
ncbi:carboxymethylenebutenolidase [Alteribacillus persepolensis]|uniref:Carboxymethylenebutenolidase n=1 Tax=Alteribacillus persepolensis TaxID=568899 RepID=A0A1G8C019_9BACI|nr:dienelactone hydrolase family protein [Alteribacillus persepolensis]SDH38679.1 carboxymethylenebutenolidase [Alteribacillus persepolensis]